MTGSDDRLGSFVLIAGTDAADTEGVTLADADRRVLVVDEVEAVTVELSRGSCMDGLIVSGGSESAKSLRIGAGDVPVMGLAGGDAA